MKLKEKESAIKFRKEGLSLKQIAEKLGVSKGSVSLWVRDIKLSEEQKIKLNPTLGGNTYARDYFQKFRKEYQKEGRALIKDSTKDFIAGLMLFWAEGSKDRCSVIFSNSNPYMIRFFLQFLIKYFNVDKNNVAFSFQWYSGNSLTFKKVKNFWLDTLDLTEKNLKRCYIDNRYPMAPGKKKIN
jgi:transcriptional regulator with XRE-family HTH domain